MQLVYIADPMCSWCYGFGPELAKLLARHPEAEVDLVMGGLRPFNTQPATQEFRDMLRGHWRHVSTASGLPFSESALDRPGFVYDTEPACRAVVTARSIDAPNALAYMKAVQLAFYRDRRDATRGDELADIAAECGFDRDTFLMRFDSQPMRDATRADFARTQSLGVGGFPTLGVVHASQLYLVTSGYVTDDVLEYRLAEIERLVAPQAAAG
ncbi:MAG TPA: DsbA family protein [Usitatibacter sp.]|nr:DsbA family protein [Usitatibacter sp.]